MKKKLLATMLVLAMALSMVACGNNAADTNANAANNTENVATEETADDEVVEEAAEEGQVLNIYCWNEEFKQRFEDYYTVPEGVTVNWVITPNADNAYQQKLDQALLNQEDAAADDKIDIFLVEADYALKYVDTPYTLDVMGDIGLTDADLSGMYQYTKDVMTDSNGVLKGVSWQATPAGFIYRRSIAEDVLGVSEPADVQAALDSWEKFDAVAADAKEKGYAMVSGYDDAYRVFSNNATTPWVVDEKIVVSDALKAWVEQTKSYTDAGYNNKANLWSPESGAGAQTNVFGYFGPGWFVDYCLLGWTLADPEAEKEVGNGTYGDWALCNGPQGFFWGGTWVCAAAGTDNLATVKDVMYTLTCDQATLVDIAKDKGDFTNNEAAMTEIANSDFAHAFLGGQNHISIYLDSANSIDMSNTTSYDQGLNEEFQAAMKEYFDGTVTEEEAYENFYNAATEKYPNLTY